jgi:hypothetical protein
VDIVLSADGGKRGNKELVTSVLMTTIERGPSV